MQKKYDIVLMGATSFVGAITAKRFAELLNTESTSQNIALAARSKTKLEALLAQISDAYPNAKFDSLIVDSMSEEDMNVVAQQARVVVSTVGPYDLYGEPLVKACVKSGTHYCDLTGEPQFIYSMLGKYEDQARQSGACIVHCSGFDSIPSDMGTYFTQQQAKAVFGEPCTSIDMRVKAASGGLSGGTFASMINLVKAASSDKSLRKMLFNPYALAPAGQTVKQKFIGKAQRDWAVEQWVAPFLMAAINTKIVLRSSRLLPDLYPEGFQYSEGMSSGQGSKGKRKAKMISAAMAAISISAAIAPLRWVLEKFLPKPGQGPSEKEQREGFYVMEFYGKTASGQSIIGKVKGDEDPGYGSTSKMLMQSALALAEDLPEKQAGGFWTPASLLGESLLERLPRTGVTFEIKEMQKRD